MQNDDSHDDRAHVPTDDPPLAPRIRVEVEALGLMLRDMRHTTSRREFLVLMPLMWDCVRSGQAPPEDGHLQADEHEFKRALRSLICVLFAACVPSPGLDPQIADDARWALAQIGMTSVTVPTVAGRPDVDASLRQIDDHVARVFEELVAIDVLGGRRSARSLARLARSRPPRRARRSRPSST